MPFNLLRLGTLIALAHTLGLIAAFHAIRTARTSQGAVAWAVSLITIPYLTLVPYLFLGSSRFAGYVDRRRFAQQKMHRHAWRRAATLHRERRAILPPRIPTRSANRSAALCQRWLRRLLRTAIRCAHLSMASIPLQRFLRRSRAQRNT